MMEMMTTTMITTGNNLINRLAKAGRLILFAAFFLCMLAAPAQEYLTPLHGNMHLMTQKHAAALSSKKIQTVPFDTMPFFDDFYYAYKSPYPSAAHWKDSSAYVNTGFPIAPPSIGVATFDGLNKHGVAYNFGPSANISSSADTLTSRPINLETSPNGAVTYDVSDSLALSFYYQAEGNGDAPEAGDSLCLDMLNRATGHWVKMWGIKGYNPGGSDTNFHYVAVRINDQGFLDSLFQFRFRNKADVTGSFDHWHIDQVYLTHHKSLIEDTTRKDVVFAYPSESLLKNYSAMPYEQFVSTEMTDSTHTFIRNNYYQGPINATYKYTIYDKAGVVQKLDSAANNVDPFHTNGYGSKSGIRGISLHGYVFDSPPNSTTFPFSDTTSYLYRSTILNSNNQAPADTVFQRLSFSNYYAYDDGAAEGAYYLNALGARMAQRFTLNTKDTLRAMDIYFDPAGYNSTQLHEFRISVWTDSGNGPSTTRLLQDSIMSPAYIGWGYNTIPRYVLTSPLVLNAGTYYFGIKQSDATHLNIGFDKNNNHMTALYYDIGFGWHQSAIPGSVMMRPIFGRNSLVMTGVKEEQAAVQSHATLYPNPAQDKVYIATPHDTHSYTTVEVLSLMGQTLLSSRYEGADAAIDISSLPNGVYFIYLSGKDAGSTPQKLIISR